MKILSLILLIATTLLTDKSDHEKVIFSSSRNGNSDIFIMNSDGTNQRALTAASTEEWSPTWISVDKISFLRQSGDEILRVGMNVNSKEEFELKQPSNCLLDDKNILYANSNQNQLYPCQANVFIYSTTDKKLENLTKNLEGSSNYPSWGPHEKTVLITSNHLGSNNIYQIDLQTKKISPLTSSSANNERGELSPDGKWLVYSSDEFEKGNQEILLKEMASGKIINVSNSDGNELIARFSAHGEFIYYGSNKDGNWEIYSYHRKSQKTIRLTENDSFDGDPRVFLGK